MEKLVIGRARDVKNPSRKTEQKGHLGGDLLTSLGLGCMALLLVLAMRGEGEEETFYTDDAVAVMSTSVMRTAAEYEAENSRKEELVVPDKKTFAAEDASVFDAIGEFFASLILGEG